METNIDRISELPNHIVEDILSRLSTKDAVRTSLLSSKWRYKWTTTPSIMLEKGNMFLGYPHAFMTDTIELAISVIDHVLSQHVGPIHKFKLHHDFADDNRYAIPPRRDIDRWMLRLSGIHIEELSLKYLGARGQYYTLPCCVFSWQNLTALDLDDCLLRPPDGFKGFENLKTLDLSSVALARDVLETLICSSPVLERVNLWEIKYVGDFVQNIINIDAPNLRVLKFFARRTRRLTFRNTSRLAEVDVRWDKPKSLTLTPGETGEIPKFFDHLLNVRRLTLKGDFLEYLALGCLPRKYPLQSLQYLAMAVSFHNRKEISAALCLLRSAPNLQELSICDRDIKCPNVHLARDQRINCVFNKLRCVRMNHMNGCKGEIEFINWILSTSPVLEKMTIKTFIPDSQLSTLNESLCPKHASERVEIIFKKTFQLDFSLEDI